MCKRKSHKVQKMLTLDQIREKLADRKLDVVSKSVGVHRNTLYGIRNGSNKDPRYSIIKALSDYLTDRPSGE
jgi:hypothetical protein